MPNFTRGENRAVQDLGEFELIKLLMQGVSPPPFGITGFGDDAAVLPIRTLTGSSDDAGHLIVSTDSLVENRDFRISYFPPELIGRKVVAINVSDIAAMGAAPKGCLINLHIPPSTDLTFLKELYRGLEKECERYGMNLLGGDTSAAGEISLALTVFGYTESEPLLRSGAKAGDEIWISGTLGEAASGFRMLEEGSRDYDHTLIKRFLVPEPRVELAIKLGKMRLVNSLIDISDGALQDLGHILTASNLGAEVDLDAVPVNGELNWGEDYELLFTASPEREEEILRCAADSEVPITKVGRLKELCAGEKNLEILSRGQRLSEEELNRLGLLKRGFQHFGRS